MKYLYKYNKTIARKAYNEGETVTIVPHKVRPNNCWGLGIQIDKEFISNSLYNQSMEVQGFDFIVDNYEMYNCNSEVGYYCAYYVEVEVKQDDTK